MPRKTAPEPQPVVKQFRNTDEIDRGIAKLRRRIDDVKELDPNRHRFNGQEKDNVEQSVRKTILAIFGDRSPEWASCEDFSIWRGGHNVGDSQDKRQRKFADGIPEAITMLEGLIKHLEEEKADFIPPEPITHSANTEPNRSPTQVTFQGDVATVAFGDNTKNVTVVSFLDALSKQIEAAEIPLAEKKTLIKRLRELSNNGWIQKFGSQAIIDAIRAIAGS